MVKIGALICPLPNMLYHTIISILFLLSSFYFKLLTCCSFRDDELDHLKLVRDMFKDMKSDVGHILVRKPLVEYCSCGGNEDLSDFCNNILKQYNDEKRLLQLRTQHQDPKVQFILDVSQFLEPNNVFMFWSFQQKEKQMSMKLIKCLSMLNMSMLLSLEDLTVVGHLNFLLDDDDDDGREKDFVQVLIKENYCLSIMFYFIKTVTESPDLLINNSYWVVNVSSEESFIRELETTKIDLPINSNILIISGNINSTIKLSECYRPHPTLNVR